MLGSFTVFKSYKLSNILSLMLMLSLFTVFERFSESFAVFSTSNAEIFLL